MSIWDEFSMEARIRHILADVPRRDHHFGRPFLTAYQIAISFEQTYRQDAQHISKRVGGKGTGERDSLARYIANQLSRRLANDALPGIEGRFLNGRFLQSLKYRNLDESVEASTGKRKLSIFRIAD